MCAQTHQTSRKRFFSLNWFLLYALMIGVATGWLSSPLILGVADTISEIVIRLLKLLSLPMIFLSVVATISGMQNLSEIRTLGRKVLFYALLTTSIAAGVGLCLFTLIRPLNSMPVPVVNTEPATVSLDSSYGKALLDLVPSNFIGAFAENHFIGVMLMAVVLGLGILTLPHEKRAPVVALFSGLFSAVLRITHWLVYLMPLGVWAFVTLFVDSMHRENPHQLQSLLLYLLCVILANVVQAFVVLPLLAKVKGLSPWQMAKGMFSALTVACFTRSSSGALPITLQCAQENLGVSRRVSNFSLPLCATINMNGCAAFILVTVLYVAGAHGITFSGLDLVLWVGIATLAAIGNAGVAMGCYFLSGALLAAMNVPLTLLGMILPIYTLIDMLETGVNVWSDACIAAIVDKELQPADTTEAAERTT